MCGTKRKRSLLRRPCREGCRISVSYPFSLPDTGHPECLQVFSCPRPPMGNGVPHDIPMLVQTSSVPSLVWSYAVSSFTGTMGSSDSLQTFSLMAMGLATITQPSPSGMFMETARSPELGYMAFTGVKKFHWHAARHWCATALLKGYRGTKPIDIRMVQIHLGHRSLRTTQRYTHVTQQEVAEVVRSRLGEIFQGSGQMTEVVWMHESGLKLHGAARIWTGVSGSQSP